MEDMMNSRSQHFMFICWNVQSFITQLTHYPKNREEKEKSMNIGKME